MKRDWDLVREVLAEVEALDPATFDVIRYGPLRKSANPAKDAQAVLLWRAGFIEGADASSLDQGDSVIAERLTWAGHDLLDTIHSKPVWERVKTLAKDKGIELTFDAVKALGKVAIDLLIKS
jgi:hypothetical protein